MTISTPSLPAESPASGAPTGADADLLASLNAGNPAAAGAPTPEGETAAAAGFADLLPAPANPEPAAPAATTNEQAAALAAALLWTPAPLLVETPAPLGGLTCADGQPTEAADTPELASERSTTGQPEAPPIAGTVADPTDDFVLPQQGAASAAATPATPPATVAPDCASQEDKIPLPTAEPASVDARTEAEPATVTANEAAAAGADRPVRDLDPLNLGRPWRAPVRQEKIAALAGRAALTVDSPRVVEGKTFLSDTQQAGRGAQGIVGTGVAKPEATMPAAPVSQPPSADHPAALPVFAVPAAGGHGPAAQLTLPESTATVTSDPAVQARDAVAAVMQVVNAQEQPATGTSRVVTLDFNFGQDNLAVRVEQLRDGTVQAHFRTDSHELRAALAHEWQQAASAPENILRFAEPVYQSAARGDQSANFGANADHGASQDQARAQQQAAAGSSARPARSGGGSSLVTPHPEAPRVRSLATSHHLQAVA